MIDAIAEAEKLVAEAPFIESEADLLEGLQYLAGCIAACTHVAFDYEREHPFLHSGTGPFTKMGLDNPDTLYFGTRVLPGHDYVVTGKRGTTTDVSFQLLGGEYTDNVVPDSETAFDDQETRHRGRRQLRVAIPPGNALPAGDPRGLQRLVGAAWLIRHQATRHHGHRAAAADPAADRKALCHSGQAAGAAGQDVAAVSAVVLRQPSGQHVGGASADPGRAGNAVLVRRPLRPDARPGDGDHAARDRRAVPRLPARQPLVHLAGLHQPPDVIERHSGASRSGRQDPHRGRRPQPRRHQLGGDARARQGLPAVPVAAGVA